MSYYDHLPSVGPSVLILNPATPLNDFSSESPGPVFFKFYVEPAVKGGLKICSNVKLIDQDGLHAHIR